MNLDSELSLQEHRAKIKNKKFLNLVYQDFYTMMSGVSRPEGMVVELGSGAGFLKEHILGLVTSDVVRGEGIDKVFFAEEIPFAQGSVAAYYMFDVFHHFKDAEKALVEMQRTLMPGGKIIMIEPYNSWWGRFIYKNFHHENFDPKAGWKIKGEGRLSDANGALPWIVFECDQELFKQKFPNLKVKQIIPHTPFRYLCSGGLSKPQLLPSFMYPVVKFVEKILAPFKRQLSMFVLIELEKV
jgi:SAM-dependent methyltransferase